MVSAQDRRQGGGLTSGVDSPKFREGGAKLHRLFQCGTQDSAKGVPQPGVWLGAEPPVPLA